MWDGTMQISFLWQKSSQKEKKVLIWHLFALRQSNQVTMV